MATPALKRSWAFAGQDANTLDTMNNLKFSLEASGTPCAVASGDIIVCAVACHNTITPTISDDKSNTWATAVTASNTTLGTPRKYTVFYAVNAAANTSLITLALGSLTTDIQVHIAVFYNTATTSPIGATIATTGIVPGSNTAPNIQPGSMTVTSGNLLYNVIFNEADGDIGDRNAMTSVTYGSGFTGLYADSASYGSAAQYQVLSGTSINPGFTFAQSPTHDSFASLAVEIKSGTGGAAPGTGIRILRSMMVYLNDQPSTVQHAFFPATGNLIVVTDDADSVAGIGLSSVSDSASNTWTHVTKGSAGTPDTFFAATPTNGNTLNISLHMSTGTGKDLITLFDIAGAATSPLDTAATAANSSTLTGANSGATFNTGTQGSANADITDASSIVPSTPSGLIIGVINLGTGPISGAISETYDFVTATFQNGGGDGNGFCNGDGTSHVFNTSTGTQNFGYHTANGAAVSWNAMATAFKAAPVSGIPFEDDSFNPGTLGVLVQQAEPVVSVW